VNKLGLEKIRIRSVVTSLGEIQPHLITLKSGVILEPPPASISSQCLCGTTKPDMSHILYEFYLRDIHVERKRILIDCGATSIFMEPKLLSRFGLPSDPAHIIPLGTHSRVMMSAKDCWETTISVQDFEHLAPVDEPDVLVVPMKASEHDIGLSWFQVRYLEIDQVKVPLLGWWTPVGNSLNLQTITSLSQGDRSAEDGACEPSPPAVDVQFLGSIACNDPLASNDIATASAIQIDEGTSLLGASTMSEGDISEKLGEMSPGQC